jgi:hypothetical protein
LARDRRRRREKGRERSAAKPSAERSAVEPRDPESIESAASKDAALKAGELNDASLKAAAKGLASDREGFWTDRRAILAAAVMLSLHIVAASVSLLRENPTVDEVVHIPAGVTYWQKGTFRLYHHNPPLVKLIAAAPVVLSSPNVSELYKRSSWLVEPPDQSSFAHAFAYYNMDRYLELMSRARLTIPWLSALGGLIVFVWSKRLFGAAGGATSLAVWCLCPNILAHGRLATTDLGATAFGVAATYAFQRYVKDPKLKRALIAGIALGLAQLSKFSMLLLYAIWPCLWLFRELIAEKTSGRAKRFAIAIGHGGLIVAISFAVIDIGYGFEHVGIKLGKFEFACRTLTRRVEPGVPRPRSRNPLLDGAWRFRVNRFRGTALGDLPVPLPEHFVLGFDEQKLEAEGVPEAFLRGSDPAATNVDPEANVLSYPVYLDGVRRRTGWWNYYLLAILYKTPEGILLIVAATGISGLFSARRANRREIADAIDVALVPAVSLATMSLATNINIGLRYVLPIYPYVFITTGLLGAFAVRGRTRTVRIAARCVIAFGLAFALAATASIHPHYLAFFNWASGGPTRGSEHLIDSNIDWGQDLVGLAKRVREIAPGERIGLAYFGQVNPNLLNARGEGFDWFLPPALPGTAGPIPSNAPRVGFAKRLTPGLYAVSVSILRGLPWSLYDPSPSSIYPAWRVDFDAFAYFRELEPIDRVGIGYSILIYRLTEADCARLNPRFFEGDHVSAPANRTPR